MQLSHVGPLLTVNEFKVFKCIPPFWWDRDEAAREIAIAIPLTPSQVKAYLSQFVRAGLVEERVSNRIDRHLEVRRTKDLPTSVITGN